MIKQNKLYAKKNKFINLISYVDPILLLLLLINMVMGLLILYSGANQNIHLVMAQASKMLMCLCLMLLIANIKPIYLEKYTPIIFSITILILLSVIIFGAIDKGAKRWLSLGSLNLQPSELLLITIPMILAYTFSSNILPPTKKVISIAFLLLLLPTILVIKQPDLGTGIIIFLSGLSLFVLAGTPIYIFFIAILVVVITTPISWHFLHQYQRLRILTFLHPESDPLGAGYHIIQSKIAIGSGGFLGKGYLQGTQAHYQFLPEHSTDFIFSVAAEELGFIFCLLFILLLIFIFLRCIYLSLHAQSNYSRLLAAGLSINFLLCALINIAMVSGLIPVVGVPLTLVSHGGSSILSTMISFGIILSCTKHQKIIGQ